MPRKAKNYDELELKDDFMFGMVMRNPKYVKPFLEAILKIKIRKVVYPESQKAIDLSANAKGVRLDVYVEDDQNTVFNSQEGFTKAHAILSRNDRFKHIKQRRKLLQSEKKLCYIYLYI